MYPRHLRPILARATKSFLLLGPRQVGKSTLVRQLSPELSINLANEREFLAHASDPALLEQRLNAVRPRSVFIDEVQRLPRMLNTIQSILDERKKPPRFMLTGSSARKLRRGRANLLPGRIHTYYLGPMTLDEIGKDFDEQRALATGMLPGIYAEPESRERKKTLRSYASTYVREEVQAEALTRNIEGFARFLRAAAIGSGQFVDQTRLANEAAVSRATVQRSYEILEDTLLAHRLDAFDKSQRRRLIQHPKYYLFDVGVYNALIGNFQVSGDRIGSLFEHLLVSQMVAAGQAFDYDLSLSSYRTEHGAEVDFILELAGETWAVEAKAARHVGVNDITGLRSFAEYFGRPHRSLIAYLGEHRRTIRGVEVWPYRFFLNELKARIQKD